MHKGIYHQLKYSSPDSSNKNKTKQEPTFQKMEV